MEERKSKRIELKATISICRLDDRNDAKMQDLDVDVFDLSTKGIGFKSEIMLPVGSVFSTKITTWNKDVINAIVSVSRCMQENNKYTIGGIFVGMSDEDKLRIGVYDIVETNAK